MRESRGRDDAARFASLSDGAVCFDSPRRYDATRCASFACGSLSTSDRHWGFDVGVGVVAFEGEVLEAEIVDRGD